VSKKEKDRKIKKMQRTIQHQRAALSKINKSISIYLRALEKAHTDNYGDIYLPSYINSITKILDKYNFLTTPQ